MVYHKSHIKLNFPAFLNTISFASRTLPIVILYVTEGCNLKCISCSYREALPNEFTFGEIKTLAEQLNNFGLKHIVFSGGEPLLRRDFKQICELFVNNKKTLLTNGLLLEKKSDDFQNTFDEIIVSIDGANAETHNKIRGIISFDIILKGIKKTLQTNLKQNISIRTVIQKNNFSELPAFIEL
ncbi:MAG: radical SAM protein, partial [Saprospiraceae bacterium]